MFGKCEIRMTKRGSPLITRIDAKRNRKQKSPDPFARLVCFVGRLHSFVSIGVLDVAALRQPVVLTMGADPIPNEAAAFKFANGTIMDAYAHTPFAATNFLSNGCSSDLQKAAKETKIFFSTSALKRSLGIAGVFRSR